MIAALMFAPLAALAAPTPAADEAAVNRLIDTFVAAEARYDPATLDRLITRDYVEVSPKGEVDARDRFLSFYALANRQPVPPLTLGEHSVRVAGAAAIAIVRLDYAIPGRPAMSVRATYIARREGTTWRLAGAQFTGIRP